VENDANALCWGELMDPSQPELSDFLCVLGETRPETPDIPVSVGLGFALGGAVHHGPEYSSGEFRSPLWNDDGPGQFRLPADVLRRIQHDSDALDALVDETAVGVSFLVNALNLSSVFLEGFFAEDFDRHARTIENALDRYWPYPGSPSCSVNRAGRGEPALCIGAAALIQHEYYGRTYLPNGIPSAG